MDKRKNLQKVLLPILAVCGGDDICTEPSTREGGVYSPAV